MDDRIESLGDDVFKEQFADSPPLLAFWEAHFAGAGTDVERHRLLEVSDSRLRYITDVQEIAGVPVLSRLPRIREESYVLDLDDLLIADTDDDDTGAVIEGESL